jgi:hypothetical protein
VQSLFPAPSPIPPSGTATLVRVLVLIAVASVIWVPIGVWVGLRPGLARIVQPVAQFLAAFPANLLFPVAVSAIVAFALNPDIWLSPLMILGTQWYILFNLIAGASALPSELRDVGTNLRVRGWLWWRRTALPGVLPFYVTGVITCPGQKPSRTDLYDPPTPGGRYGLRRQARLRSGSLRTASAVPRSATRHTPTRCVLSGDANE